MSSSVEIKRKQLILEVDLILEDIENERRKTNSKVDEDLLAQMRVCLQAIKEFLATSESYSKGQGMTLSRLICESWPLGHPLGNRISQFEARMDKSNQTRQPKHGD